MWYAYSRSLKNQSRGETMHPVSKSFGQVYKYVCTIILALMVLIVFVNTSLRYLFNTGIVENEEILRYLFIWSTFLGITAVYYEGKHISVTILVEKFPPRTAALFSFCMNFLALFALGMLVFGGIQYSFETTTYGELTGIPFTYIIAAAIFCGVASIGIVLRDMRNQLRTYNHAHATDERE